MTSGGSHGREERYKGNSLNLKRKMDRLTQNCKATKNLLTKIQLPFMIKTKFNKLEMRRNSLNLINNISENLRKTHLMIKY